MIYKSLHRKIKIERHDPTKTDSDLRCSGRVGKKEKDKQMCIIYQLKQLSTNLTRNPPTKVTLTLSLL